MFELRLDVEVAAGSLRSLERKREATPEIAEPAACTAPSSRVPVPKEFSLVGKSAAEVSALAGQVQPAGDECRGACCCGSVVPIEVRSVAVNKLVHSVCMMLTDLSEVCLGCTEHFVTLADSF